MCGQGWLILIFHATVHNCQLREHQSRTIEVRIDDILTKNHHFSPSHCITAAFSAVFSGAADSLCTRARHLVHFYHLVSESYAHLEVSAIQLQTHASNLWWTKEKGKIWENRQKQNLCDSNFNFNHITMHCVVKQLYFQVQLSADDKFHEPKFTCFGSCWNLSHWHVCRFVNGSLSSNHTLREWNQFNSFKVSLVPITYNVITVTSISNLIGIIKHELEK